MAREVREAVGWGFVSSLAFLVMVLGFQIITEVRIDLSIQLAITILVGLISGSTSGMLRRYIGHSTGNESP